MKMSPAERKKRVKMVQLSGRIYHAAVALSTKAKELEHPEADETLEFLAETHALEISRVWDPTEAKKLLIEIQDRSMRLGEIARDNDDQV
jgi:hypothetical protein